MPAMKPACRFAHSRKRGGSNQMRRPPERIRDPARRPAAALARVLEHQGPTDQLVAPHLTFLAEPGRRFLERAGFEPLRTFGFFAHDEHRFAEARRFFLKTARIR